MQLLTPSNFPDYELIDCGDFEKLERFGKFITIRPEPQAVWRKKLADSEWQKKAHVKFVSKSSSSGTWQKLKEMPDQWKVKYKIGNLNDKSNNAQFPEITFRLGLTSFKHVGIFPEQSVNWDYIYQQVTRIKETVEKPRVLNLFAYTGGASLAAKAAGADVIHLDAIKQVVSWAKENMDYSNLSDIRWLVEDAMTYVKRELKRGKTYHGIILDPPAFGHGPNGENWKLEEMINEMIHGVAKLLEPENSFLILNTYSLGFSAMIINNLLKEAFGDKAGKAQWGEIYLDATSGVQLPLGVFGRLEL